MYALLASYQNLGSSIARCLGVALIDALQIKTDTCQFQKLPHAIFIAHVVLPLVVVPLVFVLIPDANMTDNLIEDDDEAGTRDTLDNSGWSPTNTSDEDEELLLSAEPQRNSSAVDETEQ